jgi:multiple sugar transport system substrate-binding protein
MSGEHDAGSGGGDSKLTRREFAKIAGSTAVGLGLAGVASREALASLVEGSTGLSVAPNSPAGRAVAGLKALRIPAGTEFVLFGEDTTLSGPKLLAQRFENDTGLRLKFSAVPFDQQAATLTREAIAKTGAWDLVFNYPTTLADIYATGYLQTLDNYVKKYDPDYNRFLPIGRLWSSYINGKIWSMPFTASGQWLFYYRQDLLEKKAEQRAFRRKYGYDLGVPTVWDKNYRDTVEFFNRPKQNFYGAVEWRAAGLTYWWWMQRFYSAGGALFDVKSMSPRIASPAGVRALRDLVSITKFMPPDVASYTFLETNPVFVGGRAFSLIEFPYTSKQAAMPASKIKGKIGYGRMPGYVVKGKLHPSTLQISGFTMYVPQSKFTKFGSAEASYLIAQYITDPVVSLPMYTPPDLNGVLTPLHPGVYRTKKYRSYFPGANKVADALLSSSRTNPVPDILMPGYAEYSAALDAEVQNALVKGKAPAQALRDASEEWEKITDRHGRASQRFFFNSLLKGINSIQVTS